MINGDGKWGSLIVPGKLSNKALGEAEEVVEERRLAKGTLFERNRLRTQGRAGVPSALKQVRQTAQRDRKLRFTALLHYVYAIEQLRTAYFALKREAAPSIDGETWRQYGENLKMNLQELSQRLNRELTGQSPFVGHTSRKRMGGKGRSGFQRCVHTALPAVSFKDGLRLGWSFIEFLTL